MDVFGAKCGRCYKKLELLDISEEIQAEIEFRERFPKTWMREQKVRICDTCYEAITTEESPEDYERNAF